MTSLKLITDIALNKFSKKKISIFIGFDNSDEAGQPEINNTDELVKINALYFDPLSIDFNHFFNEENSEVKDILNLSSKTPIKKIYVKRQGEAYQLGHNGTIQMNDPITNGIIDNFIDFIKLHAAIELIQDLNIDPEKKKTENSIAEVSKSVEAFKTGNKESLCGDTCKLPSNVEMIPSPTTVEGKEKYLADKFKGFFFGDNKGLIMYEIHKLPSYIKETTLPYIMDDHINKGKISKLYDYITDNQIFSFLKGFSLTIGVIDNAAKIVAEKADKIPESGQKIIGKSLDVLTSVSSAMSVTGIIANKIVNKIEKSLEKDVLRLNKLKKFIFNNFISFYTSESNKVDVFLNHKIGQENPKFFSTDKIPHFNDLHKKFFSLLKSKSSGLKISPFFLTQNGIERVIGEKKDSLLFGQAMFNLGDFNYIDLKSFQSTFFIPFKMTISENFYNHKVNTCELSPMSIVQGVEIYQLRLTNNEEQSRNAFDTFENDETREKAKPSSSDKSKGKFKDSKLFQRISDENKEINFQGTKSDSEDLMNVISTIPMSNIGYIEFHITNELKKKENVYMTSDGAKILLDRLYIPYFPPFNESDEKNFKNRNLDTETEVPGHYFYEFAYSKDLVLNFRLWIHYNSFQEDADFKSVCNIEEQQPQSEKPKIKKIMIKKRNFKKSEEPVKPENFIIKENHDSVIKQEIPVGAIEITPIEVFRNEEEEFPVIENDVVLEDYDDEEDEDKTDVSQRENNISKKWNIVQY